MSNIILTGVPRSGTTLICHLLNQLPGVVALHEPLEKTRWPQDTPHLQIARDIEMFFANMRESILTNHTALSRHAESTIVDDAKGDYPRWIRWLPNRFYGRSLLGRAVLRQSSEERDWIHFDGPVNTLLIKQTGLFTALLPTLKTQFPCFAVVRNPLAVLASWNSIDFGLQRGTIPAAERFDAALRTQLVQTRHKYMRQVMILDWFFAQYHHLPAENILKYENIIDDVGGTLAQITPEARSLRPGLTSRNTNPLYNREIVRKLWQILRDSEGAFWHYYTREDCEKVLSSLQEG